VSPRTYESAVRADAAQATRERILNSAIELAYERGDIEMTLEQVAARASTTVRTIMRQFGSRDGLIEAGIEVSNAIVAAERRDPGGDRDRSIHLLVDHYELRGAFVLQILAWSLPGAKRVTASGRLLHRDWVETVFAADLPGVGEPRDAAVDMLVVATDVYAWKLLRLDRGLDPATTTDRMRLMTRSILAVNGKGSHT
jgi:AcrR family transcriptional regulator